MTSPLLGALPPLLTDPLPVCLPILLSAGANTTWWNVRSSKLEPADLPACGFGPLLNFIGYWDAPAKGRRLLLESAARAKEAVQLLRSSCCCWGGQMPPRLLVIVNPASGPGK